MTKNLLSRRSLLVRALGALPAIGLCAPVWAQETRLTVTPWQTEGPFYPRRKPLDIDNDLALVGDGDTLAAGDLLTVQGRVLDREGNPISGARVEFWHCDKHGTYHHVGSSGPTDPNFQGYGEMLTDGGGSYRFRTIKPGVYPGRACHIHFKVIVPGRRTLTSQMYFDSEMEGNLKDGIYRRLSPAEQKAVTLKTHQMPQAGKRQIEGLLDIVVV